MDINCQKIQLAYFFLFLILALFEEIDIKKAKEMTDKKIKNIGRIVASKRKEKGMSQDCLAFNACTDKSFINKIEKGTYKNVTLCTLYRISTAIGEDISIFFKE